MIGPRVSCETRASLRAILTMITDAPVPSHAILPIGLCFVLAEFRVITMRPFLISFPGSFIFFVELQCGEVGKRIF